jgi:hypothetical protein
VSGGSIDIDPDRTSLTVKLTKSQFFQLTELLLTFHSFLKYGADPLRDDEDLLAYQCNLCALLTAVTQGLQRDDNTRQFKLQKLLECSHFLKDHLFRGPPIAHSTDTGERGLKSWTKAPASTAQHRSDEVFKKQVANNLHDSKLMNMVASSEAYCTLSLSGTTTHQQPATVPVRAGARTYVYMFVDTDTQGFFSRQQAYKEKPGPPLDRHKFPRAVGDWFKKQFSEWYIANQSNLLQGRMVIQLYQDITLPPNGPNQRQCIRAHSAYSATNRYWFNYVQVQYSLEMEEEPTANAVFPARCACFSTMPWQYPLTELDCLQAPESHEEILVLVQQSMYPNNPRAQGRRFSTKTQQWTLEATFVGSSNCASGLDMIAKLGCIPHSCIDKAIFAVDMVPLKVDNDTVFVNPSRALQDPFYRFYEVGVIRCTSFDILEEFDRREVWPFHFLYPMNSRDDGDAWPSEERAFWSTRPSVLGPT